MKIPTFRILKGKERDVLQMQLIPENQAETSLLIHVANRMPSSVEVFGRVGESYTYAWVNIPLKKPNLDKDHFGNIRP